MNIQKTTLQQKYAHYPSTLDFKQILYKRAKIQTIEAKKEIYRLKMGNIGEEKLIEKLRTFGQDHWMILRNIWLSDSRQFECDIILITTYCVYVFEVKNYRGDFHYQNASSSLKGEKLDYDYIQQARKSFLKLKKILKNISSKIPVKGALVFIGENNKVSIESPVEDIEILSLTDLYSSIQEISQEERISQTTRLNPAEIIQHLDRYEINDPFLPLPLSTESIQELKNGIYCDTCGNFNLAFDRNYTICPGCLREPRKESLIRMALEYGALTYGRDYTTGDIENFINQQASRCYIKGTLEKYLDYVPNNNYSYIKNNYPLYYKSYEHFGFEQPRIQQVDRSILIGPSIKKIRVPTR